MNPSELQERLRAQLPAELLAAPPEIRAYPDEIVIVLQIAAAEPPERAEHEIAALRERTRPLRVRLAREIQRQSGLPVAWGMRVGEVEALFTTRTAPVMTRLGRAEREVLDTLVAAGIADTRSAALGYVLRAFAADHAEWLDELRQAVAQIEQLRSRLHRPARKGEPRPAPDDHAG